MVLEHHADLPAQKGNFRAADRADVLAGQQQLAAGRTLQRQQQAQQGALARPGMAGDEQELAAPGTETQLVQADMAVGIALAYLLELDHACSCPANSALTKASASNGRKSSIPSPTPM
ncbi:hypothetical protein D9M71_750070 [compost metagenome]